MRNSIPHLIVLAVLAVGLPALAQTAGSPTGARPGNEIGTGQSLPRSNKASNIEPPNTQSVIAPNLPSPPLDESAPPSAFLRAARSALAAGRTGEAQQSLEMAQTRQLDRSVPLGKTGVPSDSPVNAIVTEAKHALAAGDRAGAVRFIDEALAHLN